MPKKTTPKKSTPQATVSPTSQEVNSVNVEAIQLLKDIRAAISAQAITAESQRLLLVDILAALTATPVKAGRKAKAEAEPPKPSAPIPDALAGGQEVEHPATEAVKLRSVGTVSVDAPGAVKVPTPPTTPEMSEEDVRKAILPLLKLSQEKTKELLATFKAAKVSDIKPSQRAAAKAMAERMVAELTPAAPKALTEDDI